MVNERKSCPLIEFIKTKASLSFIRIFHLYLIHLYTANHKVLKKVLAVLFFSSEKDPTVSNLNLWVSILTVLAARVISIATCDHNSTYLICTASQCLNKHKKIIKEKNKLESKLMVLLHLLMKVMIELKKVH